MANQVKGKTKEIIDSDDVHSVEMQSNVVEGWWN
jgi:hypothetical protein